ncbi:MAG: NAD(+) diphosphatase [Kiritimatiellae bacterium]|nr:NAD(+) diphosphatase [Kiritimatiellia bacterium]MBP5226534.1 NAD(+) diphosphatase [Kiritimatiellia bacterium]
MIEKPEAFFLFSSKGIWVRPENGGRSPLFPLADELVQWEPIPGTRYAVASREDAPTADADVVPLRNLYDLVPEPLFVWAGMARQLLYWRQMYHFCSFCGGPLVRHKVEHAMHCPACDQFFYPRINPVVITLVSRGRELLLTHKAQNAYPFWSLIAGFVEANETLEQAVVREIAEEVGIRVKNIRYVTSQAWPFPNNLMCGFMAEYESGEPHADGVELDDARWCDADHLPGLPSKVSIARRLIDRFLASVSEETPCTPPQGVGR